MFFYQRKITRTETRTFKFRDEWGQMRELELRKDWLEPSDEEISEQLMTTATIRRLE